MKLKDGEECPGETICTTDPVVGRCKRSGRTLENYCHDRDGGCELYCTKENSTPVEFRGFAEAVYVCRARHDAGLRVDNLGLPYWAERAYLIGNAIYRRVENEDSGQSGDKGTDFGLIGRGDSKTFALIQDQMEEVRKQSGH